MPTPLKILMMGGRRCGKTSALASLFEQMTNGPVKEYFTVNDRTDYNVIKDGEKKDHLMDKTLELQNMLETNQFGTSIFLVDQAPTNNFWNYILHLQRPGTKRAFDLLFRDSAGEFFESSSLYAPETQAFIEECDVFVIVIDTPYLMAENDPECKKLCPNSINIGTNRVKDIHEFLTYIDDHNGEDAKMVIFVPLKCEKWAKKNNKGKDKLDEVTKRVEEVYNTHITALKAHKKINISIIPIQTCGNILFTEFREPFIYKHGTEEGKGIRCCWIEKGSIIRKENGECEPASLEEVKPDQEAVIQGLKALRPYSWYKVNPGNNNFEPKNCEQLALHIIRFMLEKYKDSRTGGLWKKIKATIEGIFGGIGIDYVEDKMNEMRAEKIIKDSGDGIKIIKSFY